MAKFRVSGGKNNLPPDDVFERNRNAIADFEKARKLAGHSDFMLAMPKRYDPTMYWEESDLPWDAQNPDHRPTLIKWLRMYYQLHHLIPILVDIFTRFPLAGVELRSKDKAVTDFFEEEFMVRMGYEDFLVKVGRDYWCLGEAFTLGHFNEFTGTWDSEECVDVEMVRVESFPLLNDPQFRIRTHPKLKELVRTQNPIEQYNLLVRDHPDLIPYIRQDKDLPVSSDRMRQVAFKVNDFDLHGTPILLRALRTLIHEEKLLNAQDAIAERLYSPLILAKLGIMDMGDGQPPWIPSQADLSDFRDELDLALSSDFRLLVHHTGLDIQSVFGREAMPRLDADFDRVEARIMRTFGIHPQLLTGGVSNVPYASSALQAEFLNQILRTYQKYLKNHFRARALVVAEAHGIYDYHKKGNKRIPIMEEHLIIDAEGNKRVVEKHKLLVPEMSMKVLDLRDEATTRQFMSTLKQAGVPVSDTTFMVGLDVDFEEELERAASETVQKTIAQQEAKKATYQALRLKGLTIPPELLAEMAQLVTGTDPESAAAGMMGGPEGVGGMGGPEEFALPGEPGLGGPGVTPPMEGISGPAGNMPESSTERTPIAPPTSRVSHAMRQVDVALDALDSGKPDEIPPGFVVVRRTVKEGGLSDSPKTEREVLLKRVRRAIIR